jgi:hypothetical protein
VCGPWHMYCKIILMQSNNQVVSAAACGLRALHNIAAFQSGTVAVMREA